MRCKLSVAAIIALWAVSIGQRTHAEDATQEAYVLTELESLPDGEGAVAYSINESCAGGWPGFP